MAPTSGKISESIVSNLKVFHCSVCSTVLERSSSFLLPCKHLCCQTCISKPSEVQEDKDIKCPTCGVLGNLPGSKNAFTDAFSQVLSVLEVIYSCYSCEKLGQIHHGKPIEVCKECLLGLCSQCKPYHEIFLGDNKHNFISSEEYIGLRSEAFFGSGLPSTNYANDPVEMCSKHARESVCSCTKCSTSLCQTCLESQCTESDNGKHQFINTESQIKQLIEEVKTALTCVGKLKEHFVSNISSTDETKNHCQPRKQQLKNSIWTQYETVLSELVKGRDELLNQVDQLMDPNVDSSEADSVKLSPNQTHATDGTPADFPGDETVPPIPTDVPGDETVPPIPTHFPGDEIVPPIPTDVPGDETVAPIPTHFPGDETVAPIPTHFPGDETIAPIPATGHQDIRSDQHEIKHTTPCLDIARTTKSLLGYLIEHVHTAGKTWPVEDCAVAPSGHIYLSYGAEGLWVCKGSDLKKVDVGHFGFSADRDRSYGLCLSTDRKILYSTDGGNNVNAFTVTSSGDLTLKSSFKIVQSQGVRSLSASPNGRLVVLDHKANKFYLYGEDATLTSGEGIAMETLSPCYSTWLNNDEFCLTLETPGHLSVILIFDTKASTFTFQVATDYCSNISHVKGLLFCRSVGNYMNVLTTKGQMLGQIESSGMPVHVRESVIPGVLQMYSFGAPDLS